MCLFYWMNEYSLYYNYIIRLNYDSTIVCLSVCLVGLCFKLFCMAKIWFSFSNKIFRFSNKSASINICRLQLVVELFGHST